MAKCLSNGLSYPFYTVSVWEWVKDKSKDNGGEYSLFRILETEDRDEAMAKAKSIKISADCPEVLIQCDDGEDINWIGTIDEYGFYDT